MLNRSGNRQSIYIHQVEIIHVLYAEVPSDFSAPPCSSDLGPAGMTLGADGSRIHGRALLLAVCFSLHLARVMEPLHRRSRKEASRMRLSQRLTLAEHSKGLQALNESSQAPSGRT